MNKQFTKSDLKDGMVVTMRDGTSHYVVRNAAEIQELAEGLSNWDIGVFNDNLKHELKSVHDTVTGYDIIFQSTLLRKERPTTQTRDVNKWIFQSTLLRKERQQF